MNKLLALRVLQFTLVALVLAMVGLSGAAQAVQVEPGEFGAPGWELAARNRPTNLAPGGTGTIAIDVFNIGARDSQGPITVTDRLPAGVTAREEEVEGEVHGGAGELLSLTFSGGVEPRIGHELWDCTGNGPGVPPRIAGASEVTCTSDPEHLPSLAGGGGQPTLAPGDHGSGQNRQPIVGIAVNAPAAAGSYVNRVSISGGGAVSPASTEDTIAVNASPPPFGVVGWDGWFSNSDGTLDTQAGSHPYEWTTSLDLANLPGGTVAGGEARDFVVKLPPGVIGNPHAVAQCTRQQLDNTGDCPIASEVGTLMVQFAWGQEIGFAVFNLVPPPGAPAELGFVLDGINTFIDPVLRSGGDYGLTTNINDVPERVVDGTILTLWGVPGDPTHDRWRNGHEGGCTQERLEHEIESTCPTVGYQASIKPFLTLPTTCAGAQSFSISADSWLDANLTEPVSYLSHDVQGQPVGFTGCGALPFTPAVGVTPESSAADTPSGLHVDVHIPQPQGTKAVESGNSVVTGVQTALAEADLKGAVVALPAGVSVNPSSASGLVGCSSAQIELHGPLPAGCPDASKIGTVEVDTPLVDHPVKGGVFVASPHDNPFGSLLAIYIALDDPATGTVVKLAGHVEADPVTGQLTTRFDETPQLPFEDFKLDFFGGPTAALRTPPVCGSFTSSADLKPWTTPDEQDKLLFSAFEVSSGPGGSGCANSEAQEPYAPAFEAGTALPVAASYSPFVLRLSREDGSQYLQSISTLLPPGLIGKLAGIAECSQADVEAAAQRTGGEEQQSPSCPSGSELGTVDVAAGAGSRPYHVTGHVYLMGPYKGAPFSLAVVTPALAGPYDLGTVVVRAALYIDPHTAQVRAVSDPIPRILQGIPLDVRSIALNLNRPGFTLNPTNCEPMMLTGEAISVADQTAQLSDRFQVGGCQGLLFKPSFTVSTQAKTSKKGGASLDVRVGYPQGAQANIRSVAVMLPKQLPARLTTIQQACTETAFAQNPASCPAGSNIGIATAHTPLLLSPLTGPAFLVSHGGAAFPDVVIVLQGEGVTLDLVGGVNIKKGITSSTFASVPDAPSRASS